MNKKSVWRLATIVVILFLILGLLTKYRYIILMGLIAGCILCKGPMKLWVKIVGFVAEIFYSMFGDDTDPKQTTTTE